MPLHLSPLLRFVFNVKNKVILVIYSQLITVFPATEFWVMVHRLRTTALEHAIKKVKENQERFELWDISTLDLNIHFF
jgi:hypothetical protein